MSIQDFHSQLKNAQQNDALMSTLRRLSLVEDLKAVVHDPVTPTADWGPWASA
jgi:hypothetical protein